MRLKKLLTVTMTAALVFVLFAIPVSAHHGHDGNRGHHESDGYSSATEPDGYSSTTESDCPPCMVDGCTEYGRHTHDDCEYYGYGCPPCTVDGCTEYGRHTHDGYEYCGYDHKYGYCDGSCETAICKDRTDRGHHSGRHHR